MNNEIDQTDWMIMGMIHAYKIIEKTKESDEEYSLNEVDFPYLIEMQRRDIEKPDLLSQSYPYIFENGNDSAHDQVHVGMMNVFHILHEQLQQGEDLNNLKIKFLINALTKEMLEPELVERYEDIFRQIDETHDEREDLR